MHPEPQLRIAADVHLEHVRATLRELGDRVLVVGSGGSTACSYTMRKRPPGSGSAKTGTTGAPVRSASAASADVVAAGRLKNVHVDGVGRLHVLIDQKRHGLVRIERAQHPANRAAAVEDGIASARTDRFEQIVQQRVVERSRQHGHRLHRQCMDERVDFPEAEMPRVEQDSAVLRVRVDAPAPRPRTPRARASHRDASC